MICHKRSSPQFDVSDLKRVRHLWVVPIQFGEAPAGLPDMTLLNAFSHCGQRQGVGQISPPPLNTLQASNVRIDMLSVRLKPTKVQDPKK